MAKKKPIKGNGKRSLILPDGTKLAIAGEDGKYWYCEGTQFFKHLGYEVVEQEVEEKVEEEAE